MITDLKKKPTKPRDASSMIIINKKKNDLYVLMGRRSAKSKFMPNIYVFPGGAVDKIDYIVNKIFNLSANIKKNVLKSKSNNHAVALMLAAIRETAEETGLYLTNHRKSLKKKDLAYDSLWNLYLRKSSVPAIDNVYYFGRAITPSYLKIRFHARFFISYFENYTGEIKTNGELENIRWVEVNEALNLPIADVTEFLINRLINLKCDKKILRNYKTYPMFTRRNNKEWIKWDQ